MSEKELKPEELIRAENLIDDGKYDKALVIMRDFEKVEENNLQNVVLCHLLECQLLFQQSLFEKVGKLSEQTYQESLGLGKSILCVDALNTLALALIWNHQLVKAFEIIDQGEELLKSFTQEFLNPYKQRKACISYLKGIGYRELDNYKIALKYLEHSLSLRKEIGIKHEIASSLNGIAIIYFRKGEVNNSRKYAEQAVNIAKESSKKLEIANSLRTFATGNQFVGSYDQALALNKQSFAIYRELNNKLGMAHVLNNMGEIYRVLGKLDQALISLEQSFALYSELGNLRYIAVAHDFLIQTLIDRNDLERAKQYLDNLEKIVAQMDDNQANAIYLLNKALLLKTNPRTRNRGKAELLFKEIIENEINFEFTILAYLNLCDLLLTELRLTNEIEVLNELNQYISQLLSIAERIHSFRIMSEIYLLKAKISLISFDIKSAKRFITQALQISERFGFTQLEIKIKSEYDDLEKKLELWEKLKESGASMSERFDLARLEEQISGMVQNSSLLTTQIIEAEVAIHQEKKICLVCRGEVLRFTYICDCGVIYCGNCAQALTDLENVCWVCKAPIDYSKPNKSLDENVEAVTVDSKKKDSKEIKNRSDFG